MTIISVKGGNSQEILDGSQDTLSLLAITTGTGLVHVGDPLPAGFDVPFRRGDQIILPANEPATLRADGFIVEATTGQYGGQTYEGGGGGGGLPSNQAIVENGTSVTLNPAPGNVVSLGRVYINVLGNAASFWLSDDRTAVTNGATAPVQNSAGAAIATGTFRIVGNAITYIRLPATVAGVSNGGAVSVRNSAGADAHPATAVVASGALTGVNLAATSAIVDNGDTFTTARGETVNIAVSAGVATATVRSSPFWEPFTMTAFVDANGGGYDSAEGLGSITNEPVAGATVYSIYAPEWSDGLEIKLSSSTVPLNNITTAAQIGVGATTYNPASVTFEQSGSDCTLTINIAEGSFTWTDGQQVPIVIIP